MADLEKIVEELSSLSVLEASELSKLLEDKWGVTAAAPVAVAAPALAQLQIEPIVSHFFVFYYGVLADITPPVALAAYAAAGIAGSNPFTTGNTAFRLGIAKALVPFVFVYSPSLLLVAQGFNFYDFFVTLISAMIGIGLIGIGFTGYLFKRVSTFQRWYLRIRRNLCIDRCIKTCRSS